MTTLLPTAHPAQPAESDVSRETQPAEDQPSKVAFTIVPRETLQAHDAISFLKDYLRRAEKGEIVSVAIVGIHQDHRVQYGFSETHRMPQLLGAVHMLSNLIMRECLKDSRSDDGSEANDDDSTT